MPEPLEPMALGSLLSRAAAATPDQTAVRAGEASLTFAQLDARADALAAALVARIGSGGVVGVPAVLTLDFAVAYYAVTRSGNVVVTVNPFLREEALSHIIAASGMVLLFGTPDLAGRLSTVLPALARPVDLVAFAPLPGLTAPTVDELLAAATEAEPSDAPTDLDAPAGIHFTSGTTGKPKGVLLSHRNLTVNAAQVAAGHGLERGAVVVNHLPTYHLMHLNSGVYAGVTQVLYPGDDTVAAIDAANTYRASRFYSLPVRLARLAANPALADLKLDTVTAILSGGSALSPGAATVLAQHFGIAVTQGYGLAETSPLTHTERLDAPRTGSVGTTVAGTQCRVVDVAGREPVPAGVNGEVQVRGPQVMRGYLDPAQPTGVDADGWFSTGDVGYQDADGYLYLVDRLKDVFKCDNELVSPAELERLLDKHPAVRECVVVDHPDPFRGAVAHAFVVLADPDLTELDAIRESVNATVPEYQHLRYLTAVPAIPRSPNGKVQRRDIRAWALRDEAPVPTP